MGDMNLNSDPSSCPSSPLSPSGVSPPLLESSYTPTHPVRNGVMPFMLSVSAEHLQRFKQLLVEENPRPGCTPLTWDQLKSARCGELVHLLTEYFPGQRAWEVARDIFAKMNQTELCLQTQRELNGERTSRTEQGGGLGGWRIQCFLSRSCGPAEQGQEVECICVCTHTHTHTCTGFPGGSVVKKSPAM